MPGRLYRGNHDPEGLFSTIPAISTGLLGILTGNYLKHDAATGLEKTKKWHSLALFSSRLHWYGTWIFRSTKTCGLALLSCS